MNQSHKYDGKGSGNYTMFLCSLMCIAFLIYCGIKHNMSSYYTLTIPFGIWGLYYLLKIINFSIVFNNNDICYTNIFRIKYHYTINDIKNVEVVTYYRDNHIRKKIVLKIANKKITITDNNNNIDGLAVELSKVTVVHYKQ